MRFLYLLLFSVIFFSCRDNTNFNLDCGEEDCVRLDVIGFIADPMPESVLLRFGPGGHIDGPGNSCPPDAYDIYMAESNQDFVKLIRIEESSGTYLVEGLEDEKEYKFKVVALHCELDSLVAPIRIAIPGTVPLPQFMATPAPFQYMEDFRLSPDGDQFIYRRVSNDWYLSSFSNPVAGELVFEEVFHAQWNTRDEIAGIKRIAVPILPNTNGITSKTLVGKNLATMTEEVLHEIENPWDFQSDVHNPDLYWIHEFHFSLDENSIYFVSNKNNGSTTIREQKVYNNLWELDLSTKEIKSISDFLPIEFELVDFVEDPKQQGNFYLLGGTYGEKVEVEGAIYYEDRVDVYYYNPTDQSLTEVLRSDEKENYLSINPDGENLVFASNRTGFLDLWSYNLTSKKHSQITDSRSYSPSFKWHHLNWISETEFMCFVRHNETNKFAVFEMR